MSEYTVIGVCSECHSDQPDQYMERNKFAQEGLPVPCKYCGGVVIITPRDPKGKNRALGQSDAQRGL